MADDREPIAASEESPKEKKKRTKKPKEEPAPRRYRDESDYDDDASQGRCSCRKEFFCSMEGILKLIEFVCFSTS